MQGKSVKRGIWAAIVALGASVVAPAITSAAFVPWTVPAGQNTQVKWAGGGSTDALWGDPVINGLTFAFHPDQFRAESSGGGADTVDGLLRFSVDILPDPVTQQPRQITGFAISEFGSYSILGIGSVKASGLLDIENRDNNAHVNTPFVTNPVFPVSVNNPFGGTSGSWNGVASIQNLPNGVQRVTITVDNTLQASSGAPSPTNPGGTAYIDKKGADGTFTVSLFIPEPTSMAAVFAGVSLLLTRRRSSRIA